MKRYVLSISLVISSLLIFMLAIQVAMGQGRPDLTWMRGGFANGVNAVAYSPDGTLGASGSGDGNGNDRAARIWRLSDGMILRTFYHAGNVTQVYFLSASANLVTLNTFNTIQIWRISDGKATVTIGNLPGTVNSIAVSPDGTLLAAGISDNSVRVWRTDNGHSVYTLSGHTGPVNSVSFSLDSKFLVSGSGINGDLTARIWNMTNGTAARTINVGTADGAYQVAFSLDGNLLLVGILNADFRRSANLGQWRLSDGGFVGWINTATHLLSFSLSPDKTSVLLVEGSHSNQGFGGNTLQLADIASGNPIRTFPVTNSNQSEWHPWTAFSPDGQLLLVGGEDGHILNLRRVSDAVTLQTLSSPIVTGRVIGLAASADGRWLGAATFSNGPIAVRNAADGTIAYTVPSNSSNGGVAFSPDSKLLATDDVNGKIALWKADTGAPSGSVDGGGQIAFSPNGLWIASAIGKVVRVSDGATIATLSGGSVAFSPDNKLLGIGANLYRTSNWMLVRSVPSTVARINAVAFSPDDTKYAVAGGSTASRFGGSYGTDIFDVATGVRVRDLPSDGFDITSCAFSPDGYVIATGDYGGHIFLWSTANGSLLSRYDQETGNPGAAMNSGSFQLGVQSLAYSPDGKSFYYGRSDGVTCTARNPFQNNIIPNHGGNTGTVTVKLITEPNFPISVGTVVKLHAAGQKDIVGVPVQLENSFVLDVQFDLRSAALGKRDVIIRNTDGSTRTYAQGFAVENAVLYEMQADIVGRTVIRGGSSSTFLLIATNPGNIDSLPGTVAITFPKFIQWLPNPTYTPDFVETTAEVTALYFDFPAVPADTSIAIPVTLSIPGDRKYSNAEVEFNAFFGEPSNDDETGGEGIQAAGQCAPPTQNCFGPIDELALRARLAGNQIFVNKCWPCTQVSGMQPWVEQALVALRYRIGCPLLITGGTESVICGTANSIHHRGHWNGFKVDLCSKNGCINDWLIANAVQICPNPTHKDWVRYMTSEGYVFQKEYPGQDNEHWDVDFRGLQKRCPKPKRSTIVTSVDPNEIDGPAGFATQRWCAGTRPLYYTVHFLNEPTAAPAQVVTVTDHLDPGKYDLESVRLGSISVVDRVVSPSSELGLPVGLRQFDKDIPLPNKNLIARIHASLDLLTGDLTWTLTSIDPATGLPLPPDDPNGFLGPGEEGCVVFSVIPRAGLPTGAVITDSAVVVFDGNPLPTPDWSNTLDNDVPRSRVASFSGRSKPPLGLVVQPATSFPVSWASYEVGSGLKSYTVSISDNGGPFMPWITTSATNATFNGKLGHIYAFRSTATDNALNIEPDHPIADAATLVVRDDLMDVTDQVTVEQGIVASLRAKGRFQQTIKLTNRGGKLTGPVSLVLDGLSSKVTVQSVTGKTNTAEPAGSPYVNILAGDWKAGASTTVVLQLDAPSASDIAYSVRILAGPGKR